MAFTTVTAVLRAAGLASSGHHRAAEGHRRAADGSAGRVSRTAVIEERQLRLDGPLLTQISRVGSVEGSLGAFSCRDSPITSAPYSDAHLVVAGPWVSAVSRRSRGSRGAFGGRASTRGRLSAATSSEPGPSISCAPADAGRQKKIPPSSTRSSGAPRSSSQKSLAEGFGLTIAEAMWKERPIVASRIGGIREQIEDGRTGFLVGPADLRAFGERVERAVGRSRTARSGWARRRRRGCANCSSGRAISASTCRCSITSWAAAAEPQPPLAPAASGHLRRGSGGRDRGGALEIEHALGRLQHGVGVEADGVDAGSTRTTRSRDSRTAPGRRCRRYGRCAARPRSPAGSSPSRPGRARRSRIATIARIAVDAERRAA